MLDLVFEHVAEPSKRNKVTPVPCALEVSRIG